MARDLRFEPHDQPAGGWGSVRSLFRHATNAHSWSRAVPVLPKQNKPGGFMCVSCAWAKPAEPHSFEFCENGAKATFWELTTDRVETGFFADHTVSDLLGWSDHALEAEGRLTRPMRYHAPTDTYVVVSWKEAFDDIGARLKAFEPDRVVFYASGRASLETSYMYQLFARLYGTNNLPDSSNMCHETTSKALPESIGVPVGTVRLDEFDATDCILSFGQNVGSNAPRMLHPLQRAAERGVPIVVFNPLRERGWETFINPQAPGEMITREPTDLASQYHQVRAGGDIAVLMGMCKVLVDRDDEAREAGAPRVLDVDFIQEHTHGFEDFISRVRASRWDEIERASGLSRQAIEAAATTYLNARRVIAIYGMGLTQHRRGVDSIQMLINLLLLRGNIGRHGAGILPVRGHSNVQGQRTVGIADEPHLVPLDRLAAQYHFEPPRNKGLNTVEACEGIIAGTVDAFIGLGGNFVRAIPDRARMEPAWRRLKLAVHVATKLNRSHLITAETTYVLPCLGRLEVDEQATGPQIVTMEDSTACIHASRGVAPPAGPHLLSEPKIVAELAKATLPSNSRVPWDDWVADYGRIRDAIEETFPEDFKDMNRRMGTPGGFPRPLAARERRWNTDTGRANFKCPSSLNASFDADDDPAVMRLLTLRSNDQFNTTVYGYDDRFRGIHGSRMVLMMNADDIIRLGLTRGGMATLTTVADDGVSRRMDGFTIVEYNIPHGCCGAYYPECNALIPLSHYAEGSKTPAAKSVPVRVSAQP
ncbi:FdhF/YdeP family oxidoreductase [Tistrella bauzanensis]|jgi:molybdopterin-dependent oxidoreductase alpha subunit|uniref:FdhF/YdeP family oxidoreductase n=1 Tax=Tistrella arctica TaxID=3133430 RepID=A0ABU9YM39_9PROT